MAHLTGTLALAGSILLGSLSGTAADVSVESRLEAEVGTIKPAPKPPASSLHRKVRRVLPSLRESRSPAPVPVQVQRDASAGVRI